jgi:predicted GNAT superfamily acetyltransferase
MGTIAIRAPRRAELREGAGLLAAALGFAERDAIPAWLMAVTDGCGGMTLVAVDGDRVAGVSHAFPDLSGERAGLYSCGLAVRPEYRRLGLARSLKLEQRRRARRAGYTWIRWTADPRNAAALSLYLPGLGARLVAYHAGLHDGLRAPTGAPDDVEIVWPLTAHSAPDGDTRWVALGELDRVRAGMRALLADGYVGVDVDRREVPRVGFRRPVAA